MTEPARAITHGRILYTEVPLDGVLDVALSLRQDGKRWHSHVLSPGCAHNAYPGRFAVVVEDDQEGRACIAASSAFPDVDRALVKLLHGDDILDKDKTAAATGATPPASGLPARLADIDRRGVGWHHHMHFPRCALSPEPGRWTISVESDEGAFYETFDNEPVDVLRELEVLYFARMDGVHADD